MKRRQFRVLSGIAVAMTFAIAARPARSIDLPPETVQLRASDLAGYRVAVQACGICHSADYVAYQPPMMTKTQWTAEMAKMQHAYGAPISDEQVRQLGIYLAASYGDASSVSAEDRTPPAPVDAAPVDPVALLNAKGCLGCHQIKAKLVGPAYHDVAAKYRADPKASAVLEQSIRKGSMGKWGAVPMPPFASLSDAQVRVLAKFILLQ